MILNKWLTIEYIEEQENTVAHEFHSFLGKEKVVFVTLRSMVVN